MIGARADLRVRVEKLVAGGDGLGRDADGRVVLVTGALPGEEVAVEIRTSRRDLVQGRVAQVLDASPARREPPCPRVAAGCGGCGWQHIDPAAQLGFKVAIVREALARTGRLPDASVAAGPGLPHEAVRTSARLAVAADGRLGFRAARRHDTVPTERCLVLHPMLDAMLPGLRAPGAAEVRLRVGVATGERTAWATASDGARRGAPRAAGASGATPAAAGVGGAGGGSGSLPAELVGLGADVGTGPQAAVHEDVAGHRFRVSAASFFQSSPQGAAALVEAVRRAGGDALARAATAVDAYSGVGLFAATVFGEHARVTAVESSPSACADARVNVPGVRVVRSAVERWRPAPADAVVADPSRSGLDRGGVAALAATGAACLVLVSCDPVSLARDARLLADTGYQHVHSEVLDLFPHTPHVEVVTRFERA